MVGPADPLEGREGVVRVVFFQGESSWKNFYVFGNILLILEQILRIFCKFLQDFGKNLGYKNFKRANSKCSKLPARFFKKLILPNCQKCQKQHFDHETFLIFLQKFHLLEFLAFSNPKPYGYSIFQILNPKPQNCNFPKFSFFQKFASKKLNFRNFLYQNPKFPQISFPNSQNSS